MKASNTKSLLKNFARYVGSYVVVGPNLNPKNKARSPKWSVRLGSDETGLPKHQIAISNVGIARANHHENSIGCSYRAAGFPCRVTPADIANMKPVKFRKDYGDFDFGGMYHRRLSKLVLLPNGSSVGLPVMA